MKKLLYFLVAVFVLSACSNDSETSNKISEDKTVITVSAAASLKDALNDIEKAYEKEHKHVDLKFNYGASGALAQQIKSGAPVDVFISAAEDKVDDLVKDKKVNKQDTKQLLKNHLVIISKDKLENMNALTSDQVQKIALGNPDLVPAGKYGKQALERANLYEKLKPKYVLAKDVRQVLTYVETENVEAGIVYTSDLKASDKIKNAITIEYKMHDEIIYPAAIVKDTKHMKEAKAFYDYLEAPESIKVFEDAGFDKVK